MISLVFQVFLRMKGVKELSTGINYEVMSFREVKVFSIMRALALNGE
jgi:hypothetical protein